MAASCDLILFFRYGHFQKQQWVYYVIAQCTHTPRDTITPHASNSTTSHGDCQKRKEVVVTQVVMLAIVSAAAVVVVVVVVVVVAVVVAAAAVAEAVVMMVVV